MRFMWWGGDARHEATLAVIDQFIALNPGMTIDAEYGGMDGYYQKLTTQISSGTEPDEVVAQRPKSGTELEEGKTVTLTVSLGNTLVTVPELTTARPSMCTCIIRRSAQARV